MTILVTDLVGSTRLLGGLDAHRAETVRLAHMWQLRASIQAHHGHEVQSLGDGIMASFDSASDGAYGLHSGV